MVLNMKKRALAHCGSVERRTPSNFYFWKVPFLFKPFVQLIQV